MVKLILVLIHLIISMMCTAFFIFIYNQRMALKSNTIPLEGVLPDRHNLKQESLFTDQGFAFDRQSYAHELEILGELYYENQKKERGCDRGKELVELTPQYPCVLGVTPLGSNFPDSIVDGHKFACGLREIKGTPIVYSFGSAKHQEFEEAFLRIRPDAKIFVFEIDPNQMPSEKSRMANVQYYNIGLGYDKSNKILMSLKSIMKMLNHGYIDVLKMDIEGFEWEFIANEISTLGRVGQFLVELHLHARMIHFDNVATKFGNALHFLKELESQNLRLFFKEINTNSNKPCEHVPYYTELSFMQTSWGKWDSNKGNFSHV
jgi:hypothetical protein